MLAQGCVRSLRYGKSGEGRHRYLATVQRDPQRDGCGYQSDGEHGKRTQEDGEVSLHFVSQDTACRPCILMQ